MGEVYFAQFEVDDIVAVGKISDPCLDVTALVFAVVCEIVIGPDDIIFLDCVWINGEFGL